MFRRSDPTLTIIHHQGGSMKKSVFAVALLLVVSVVLSLAQDKATLSTYRVFPKPGKDEALKKAIAAHAAKFHTGNWKWRVFSVLSGSDEGAYQINEGPNSWTDLEGRKDISEEHMRDYEANVAPLVEKSTPHMYLTYQRQISSDSAIGPLKKALLRHFYPKPGKGVRLMSAMTTWKKVYEKLGLKAVAFWSFFSGQPQLVVATRLPNGFVDLEQTMGPKMREAFEEIAGPGSHARYLEDLEEIVSKVDEEIIEFLPDLSSK
jgi:hypothetical protein